ncbi:thioesterase family protein [Actinocorallia longicatena]|uniref:Thioesterase family protein n=1 Tax=Actinocorallia longicatena TaxID=111803 RepID=A0ABP6QEN8_9ACTN
MPPYSHPITPRFFEIDSQGVMFNMWYLGHVDDAITGYFDAIGFPYPAWEETGIDVHVVHTDLDWTSAIRLHDTPHVLLAPSHIGRTSFTLAFAFAKDGAPTCTGTITYVTVARDGTGKVPLPERLLKALGPAAPTPFA